MDPPAVRRGLGREQRIVGEKGVQAVPQVAAAIEYAKAYPKRGRPYPARSLKRALGELADLGVFDDGGDRSEIAPRKMR